MTADTADRLVRCEPGTVIETWHAAHGPDDCTEERLLDLFTQNARLLWAHSGGRPNPELAGARGVAFHHAVRSGDVVRTMVRLIPGTASTMFFAGRCSIADGPLAMTVDNLVLTVRRPDSVLRASE